MKKRTKKYNPNKHAINPNSAFDVINLVKPVGEKSKERLALDAYLALDAFKKNAADKSHFDVLASTVDLAMMVSKTIFENAFMDEVMEAREAMIRCKDNFIRTEKLELDDEGYSAIAYVIEIYFEQLNHLTGAEVTKFIKTRVLNIRSGNYYKSAEVAQAAAA